MMKWLKKNASTILTCIGGIGVVYTAVLAAKAAPKAITEKKRALEEKGEELTTFETLSVEAPVYVPAIAVGTGTLICIFGANILNRKQQAALISAYAALEKAYSEYRQKVIDICGEGTDHMIKTAIESEANDREDDNPPWDEVQTFYLEGCSKSQFFERTMQQVMQAEYHLNRNFILEGHVTFNEFLELLGLDPVEEGEIVGWTDYWGETFYGYRWIDFEHRHYITEDGLSVCAIDIPFGPHLMDEEDWWRAEP